MAKDESFNAGEFMSATIDAPMDTEFAMCPEGTFQAMIGDFDEKAIERFEFEYQKGEKAGQPGSMIKFTIPFSIQDATVLTQMGRETVIVEQQLILDTNDLGQLDFGKGKNVRLGQVRAAVNQNQAGAWSPMALKGQGPVMVQVSHDPFKRKDGTDGKAARVVRVVALRK